MSFLSGDTTRENSSTVLNEAENRRHCQSGRPVLAVIAKNSIANLAKMAALSVTVFLLPPLLVRVLNKSEYATWMLILQIGTYVALCDGSIQSAISRFVGRSRGLNDDRYMGQMLSSAGVIMLAIALLTAIRRFSCYRLKNGHCADILNASRLTQTPPEIDCRPGD